MTKPTTAYRTEPARAKSALGLSLPSSRPWLVAFDVSLEED
jgi:hypothetical protein